MMPAPIALFVYNRPWHTRQTVESLQKNGLAADSDLIVFSDGPKNEKDTAKVEEVREYVRSVHAFKSVSIHESQSNRGLANSIISGVTRVLEKATTVIVLEDDLITSPHFLTYMNRALAIYENEERVISIHAYMWPVQRRLPETLFIRGADCWGWATWRRGWKLFNPEGKQLLNELRQKGLTHEFDFWGTYPYVKMLRNQIRGANDSWAIRWYASAFLQDRLTLYPGRSLVSNIGNDLTGMHGGSSSAFDTTIDDREILIARIPLEEDTASKRVIAAYLKMKKPPLHLKLLNKIKSLLR